MTPASSSRRFPWLLSPALVWMFVFFLLPLGLVIAVSLATRKGGGISWEFSIQGWQDAFKEIHTRIFWRTLRAALMTTAACLLIGLPACFFIVQRTARLRSLLYALILIPLVANSLSLVYAWRCLLFEDGLVGQALGGLSGLLAKIHPSMAFESLYNTGWASLIGMVYYYLPFMVYPIYTSLDKLDGRLLEASADLGATARQSLWHVTLPLILPGIGTGCVMVFIQTMGTFVIPDILAGNKEMLYGTLINQKFIGSAVNWPLGSALSLLLMAVIGVALLVYFRLQDKLA